jgi:hypothetical protein
LQPAPRQSSFHDWSMHHVLYSRFGTMAALEAARRDPRAGFHWREMDRQTQASRFAAQQRNLRSLLMFRFPTQPGRFPARSSSTPHIDWSINLGAAGTAPAMYPAKYTFDTTLAPSCANDFVVFAINADGSATQANLVAFNNLYSGITPSNGICNRGGTSGGTDTPTSATVMWSYNVQGIAAGAVPTSPVLSLDGTKVAFVESASGAAHFHVLAWKATDGVDANNKQNTLAPRQVTTFSAVVPVAGANGVASDLAFGATTDTLSSPYIDYAKDTAYVGNDAGVLFRFKNVFCPAASCGTAAPSLDTAWGSGTGSVTVCSGKLTAPVQDVATNNILVGCADGKLYSISQAGVIKSLTVGDGVASKTFGAIVDPPIVDSGNGFVYAVSGSASNGTIGVLVQAKLNFSSSVAVPIGDGNQCNIHAPAVNNAYFTSPTNAAAMIFIGGATGTVGTCTAAGATGGRAVLYGAKFGAGGVLNSGAPANSLVSNNNVGSEYAPMTEFFNPNIGGGQDDLFVGLLRKPNNGLFNLYTFNVTAGWNGTPLNDSLTIGLGTSGIVVDNSSTSNQASSIYFNALNQNAACGSPQTGNNNNGCATKLTQATLQ